MWLPSRLCSLNVGEALTIILGAFYALNPLLPMGDAKMKNTTIRPLSAGYTAAICALAVGIGMAIHAAEKPDRRMLAHDVYFTLKDRSAKAKAELVAGCKKYLADHPGTVWFAAGALVAEHEREVNDRGFDVALHIVFKNKAAHDKYQDAPEHHKFIEEYNANWETVRVFDSWLDASSHGEVMAEPGGPDQAKKIRLPDSAALFAGMVRGKVVAKINDEIVVAVEKVTRVWRTSKAEDPEALEGKRVLIGSSREDGHYAKRVARFIDSLKPGEAVTLDVAHKGKGEALTILELTEEQRERVE